MYENKISARQLRRMIFIEIFGAGALSIPTFACYKEQNGFWSLIFYGVFLAGTIAFFIIFSGKISEENFENRKIGKTGLARNVNINVSKMQTRLKSINFPEVLPQPIKFVYMIRFFINAVALFFYYFSCCDFALLQLVYNITKKSQIFRNHFSVDYHDVFYCCDFIIYRN